MSGLESGNIKLDSTPAEDRLKFPGVGPSRFVSLDVKVSDSAGGNPFDGYSDEQAIRSLYWPGGVDPTFTEVGAKGTALKTLAVAAQRYIAGNSSARSAFQQLLLKASPETKATLDTFLRHLQYVSKTRAGHVALDLIDDLLHDLATISGPAAADDVKLYLAMSTAGTRLGVPEAGNPNSGACGQIGAGMVTDLGTSAGLTPAGEHWVRVTLVGTEYGTLIDQLKVLAPASGYCPPVEVDARAGQVNMAAVTTGCEAPVTGVRLLSRSETDSLPVEALRQLHATGSDAVLDAGALGAAFRRYSYLDYDPGDVAANSVSVLADGNAGLSLSTDGAGVLYYKPPTNVGGGVDGLVAGATDASGVEHFFLIKVAVKSPPRCIDEGFTGFLGEDHSAYMQDGTLQLTRNTPFTIDPKVFCATDWRNSYQVKIETGIQGTTSKINADGTITYSWTDPDVVGSVSPLKVTAWDEQTGAPSDPIEVKVNVRDVDPVCQDIQISYDMAAMKGEPLAIPLNCTMTGGLAVVNTPIPRISSPSGDDGKTLVVDGGIFTATVGGLTFTPHDTVTGVVTAPALIGWNLDPWAAWDFTNRHSGSFSVDVSIR